MDARQHLTNLVTLLYGPTVEKDKTTMPNN